MIEIRNATYRYKCKKTALEGINWSIGCGMYGLLGPNGAGKTTLLRLLATLARPDSGEIRVAGIPLTRPEQVREQLGYLPQRFELPERMTLRVFLDYAAAMRGITSRMKRNYEADRLMAELNLEDEADKRIGALSSGMKQRAGLAQAMVGNPPVLIVDEPTVGLDPEERLRLRNVLARYSSEEGRTVILSTHLLPDVELSCRSMAVLRGGRLIRSGTSAQIAAAAAGRVWSVEVSEREFAAMPYKQLIRATRTGDGICCRVLSQVRPGSGAVLLEPCLEDGYMALLGEDEA